MSCHSFDERIAKVCTHSGLTWPEALNFALWDVRNAPQQPAGLPPAEILCGRPLAIRGTSIPAKSSLLDGNERLSQCDLSMQKRFENLKKYAQWYQSPPPEIQVPDTQPGDEVLVKVFL